MDRELNGENGQGPVDHDFLRRLERGFNEQEREYQKTRDDVNSLKNQQTVIQRDISSLSAGMQALHTKLDEKSKTNWPAIALAATMFIAVVPGLTFVMTAYTGSVVAPIVAATTLNSDAIKHFVDALHVVETAVAAEIGDRRSTGAATKVSLAEIESQFHALSNVENLRAAQQERLNSLMWEKSHPGERYPNGTFFPTSIFGGPSTNNMTP